MQERTAPYALLLPSRLSLSAPEFHRIMLQGLSPNNCIQHTDRFSDLHPYIVTNGNICSTRRVRRCRRLRYCRVSAPPSASQHHLRPTGESEVPVGCMTKNLQRHQRTHLLRDKPYGLRALPPIGNFTHPRRKVVVY